MAVFIISWKPTDIEPKVLVHRETKYTCTWNGKHMSWQVSGSPGQRLRIIRARWESSSCVVLRAPQTIGSHTHVLFMPIHGQRGRKRVSVGRGADSVKEEGDQHKNRDKRVTVCIPFCKGTSSLSRSVPLSYFIHVFVCCVVYSCTPCAWQSARKECVNAMKWMGEYSLFHQRKSCWVVGLVFSSFCVIFGLWLPSG